MPWGNNSFSAISYIFPGWVAEPLSIWRKLVLQVCFWSWLHQIFCTIAGKQVDFKFSDCEAASVESLEGILDVDCFPGSYEKKVLPQGMRHLIPKIPTTCTISTSSHPYGIARIMYRSSKCGKGSSLSIPSLNDMTEWTSLLLHTVGKTIEELPVLLDAAFSNDPSIWNHISTWCLLYLSHLPYVVIASKLSKTDCHKCL